jgi:hypothetical protein
MQDYFVNILYGCGVVASVSVTLAIVRWSVGYIFRRSVKIYPNDRVGADELEPASVRLDEINEELAKPATAAKPPSVVVPPLPGVLQRMVDILSPEVVELAPFECGHCHKEVRSASTGSQNGPDGDKILIYDCEHCGARLGMKPD